MLFWVSFCSSRIAAFLLLTPVFDCYNSSFSVYVFTFPNFDPSFLAFLLDACYSGCDMCSVFVDSCGGEVEHVRLSGKAGTLRQCSRQWLDECWEEHDSTAQWSRRSTWGLHLNLCLRLTVQCVLRTYVAQVTNLRCSIRAPAPEHLLGSRWKNRPAPFPGHMS